MAIFQRSIPITGLTTYHARLLFGFNTTFLLLALVSVILRIYARRIKRASFVAEDYCVFVAMVV